MSAIRYPGCPRCRGVDDGRDHSDACNGWRFVVGASPEELDAEYARLLRALTPSPAPAASATATPSVPE